ncbi:MAG: alkaline phosphatase D family protein [Bacteroidota bacterium]
MTRFSILLSCFLLFSACKTNRITAIDSQDNGSQKNATDFIIAFGSCNKTHEENVFWDDILNENPDVWIWGGDNIYADTKDMEKMEAMYSEQKNIPGYKALVAKTPILGTWDDHDYGANDAGKEFSKKQESQQLFLDFFNVPKEDSRRAREGVYASHTFEVENGSVKIITLDTRYFRSSLDKDAVSKRRYKINTDDQATILGDEQWAWLEDELRASNADFNIIVSSIQFLSWEHGFETWGNYPKEVARLKQVLMQTQPKRVIFLSGDRHISEFSKTKVEGLDYPIWDFTSSGLTHSYHKFKGEPNQYRVGEVVSEPSYGVVRLNLAEKKASFKIMGENGRIMQEVMQSY